MNISVEGWIYIGMVVLLILAGIASAIHVISKDKPEFMSPDANQDADGEVVLIFDEDVTDDD